VWTSFGYEADENEAMKQWSCVKCVMQVLHILVLTVHFSQCVLLMGKKIITIASRDQPQKI
jgi:hypothetical protein